MSPDDLSNQIALDADWRIKEQASLRRRLSGQHKSDFDDAPVFVEYEGHDYDDAARRTLIVMTYAHIEGFFKLSVTTYRDFLCSLSEPCGGVLEQIAASCLHNEFDKLKDNRFEGRLSLKNLGKKKTRQALVNTDFVEKVREIDVESLSIPDGALSTDSNLSLDVIGQVLFRLGIPSADFDPYDSEIGFIVGARHQVAHGNKQMVRDAELFARSMGTLERFSETVRSVLFNAAYEKKYLR